VWKFDILDEQKIPRQYLLIDEVGIRAAIRSGVREIEGLKIYEDFEISVRS
jgi:hypothetical protein